MLLKKKFPVGAKVADKKQRQHQLKMIVLIKNQLTTEQEILVIRLVQLKRMSLEKKQVKKLKNLARKLTVHFVVLKLL